MEDKKLIQFRNIVKEFDGQMVLKGIDLDIYENEFVTLLGPSGCGKTTLLRILGGFIEADEGKIIFDGEDIGSVPPYKRELNTVFQKYALFPHMTVEQNIAFGLKIKKMGKDVIEQKVMKMLKLIGLEGFEDKNVTLLSGGQQQRVAIARALINEPKVLLLDEPLAALDLKLRKEMQYELKRIQQEVGITFIFVTHDQEEALTLSDRIAVFNNGYIEQVGTPYEIYNSSKSEFVCDFIGDINRFGTKILTSINEQLGTKLDVQKTGFIRIEKCVNNYMPNHAKITGTVTELEFNGILTKYTLSCMGETIKYLEKNDGYKYYKEGDEVDLYIDYQDIMQF